MGGFDRTNRGPSRSSTQPREDGRKVAGKGSKKVVFCAAISLVHWEASFSPFLCDSGQIESNRGVTEHIFQVYRLHNLMLENIRMKIERHTA